MIHCSPSQDIKLVPLTDSVARKHLKNASQVLDISPTLRFHAFRRAGASWAFTHGVPLEHIMRHGTWKSDAIWTYLSSSPSTSFSSSPTQLVLLGPWVSLSSKNVTLIFNVNHYPFHTSFFHSKTWFTFV